MFVGILSIELYLIDGLSLKDKRIKLKSLLEHVRRKFHASAAEVDELDKWQKSTIGIALVGNDKKFINRVLSKVVDFVRDNKNLDIVDYSLEIL